MGDDALGPLERRVMAILWEHGPQTPRQALGQLNGALARPLAYTTVMTILVRLAEKGLVARHAEGRTFRYVALVREADVAAIAGRRELDRLLDRYGAAGVASFAADLGPKGAELIERLRSLAHDGEDSR